MLTPRVIKVDKNAAYPKAIAELKASGMLPKSVELRQVKYLNNLVEQDHHFIKRLVKPGLGFFSFETAWRRLQGYEVMVRHLTACEIPENRARIGEVFSRSRDLASRGNTKGKGAYHESG